MKNKIKFGDIKRFEELMDELNLLMEDIHKYNKKAYLINMNNDRLIYLAKDMNNISSEGEIPTLNCNIGLNTDLF